MRILLIGSLCLYLSGCMLANPATKESTTLTVQPKGLITLTGRVTSMGHLVNGIHVDLYHHCFDDKGVVAKATTSKDGIYRFENLIPGKYSIGLNDWLHPYQFPNYAATCSNPREISGAATVYYDIHVDPRKTPE